MKKRIKIIVAHWEVNNLFIPFWRIFEFFERTTEYYFFIFIVYEKIENTNNEMMMMMKSKYIVKTIQS